METERIIDKHENKDNSKVAARSFDEIDDMQSELDQKENNKYIF